MILTLAIMAIIIGATFSVAPRLIQNLSAVTSTFDLIEQRTKWGVLLGAGLFLLLQNHFNNWIFLISGIFLWFTVGVIIARMTGIIIEDPQNKKQ